MNEENGGTATPQMVLVDIPTEYADAGALANVRTEDGKLDVAKLCKKVVNQESLLGKRAHPTKDSPDNEVDEYMTAMSKDNPLDETAFDGIDSAKALKETLRNAGLLTKQVKMILDAYKTDLNQQYSEAEFTQMLNDNLTREEVEIAKKVMSENAWNDTMASRNKEAITRLKMIAEVGKAYNVGEKGIGAGTMSAMPQQKKGMCQEYVNEMMEAARRNASAKEKDAIMSKYGYNHQTGEWDL